MDGTPKKLFKHLVTMLFNIYFGKLVHTFGKLVHIFGELVHIFGELVHIFAWKLVSRTSKQVSRNLGPLWQPVVYNDTNVIRKRRFRANFQLCFWLVLDDYLPIC